jgi:rhodanese-related sulfurtransferase
MRSCLVAVAIALFAPFSTQSAEHTKDSLETVKKTLSDGKAILVDVREQSEWDDGHLKDAKLLPLSKLKDAKADDLKELPKDKVIYLHCAAGGRCLKAAEALEKLGFQVKALKPGYQDLLKNGFEPAKK